MGNWLWTPSYDPVDEDRFAYVFGFAKGADSWDHRQTYDWKHILQFYIPKTGMPMTYPHKTLDEYVTHVIWPRELMRSPSLGARAIFITSHEFISSSELEDYVNQPGSFAQGEVWITSKDIG